MPGVLRVGVPVPVSAPVVVAGSAAYGWLDGAGVVPGGQQGQGSVALAYAVVPQLTLGAQFWGHVDRYEAQSQSAAAQSRGAAVKAYGEPRLLARYAAQLTANQYLGADMDVRVIGAEAPSIEPSALTGAVRALFGSRLNDETWVAAQVGGQWDNSAEAVPEPVRLSAADERALGASSWSAVQWGVGASHVLGWRQTELLLELTGDVLVGEGRPETLEAPLRVGLGARQPLGRALTALLHSEVSLSRRPQTLRDDTLQPIEPRLLVGVGLIWSWSPRAANPGAVVSKPPPRRLPPPVESQVAEKAAPAPITLFGSVVDEGGRPLSDVEVSLASAEGAKEAKPSVVHTSAEGRFELQRPTGGAATLLVACAGFEPLEVALLEGQTEAGEIVLRPAVPAGQVRGKVTDLRGSPLPATIRVQPGELVKQTAANGAFEIELAPGRYEVVIEHEGFGAQRRRIEIRDRGVVILNIGLEP